MKSHLFVFFGYVAALSFSGLAQGQSGYSGAGIGSQPFSGINAGPVDNTRMLEMADQISTQPKPFALPEWMKPKFPTLGKPKFLTPANNPPSWPQLPKPKWLTGGDADQPADANLWNQESSQTDAPGLFAGAGKNFNQWRQRTGEHIRNTNANIRETTAGTWQNFSKGIPRPGWLTPNSGTTPPPVQPPLRSAENWNGQATDRF